jgi:ferredoxin
VKVHVDSARCEGHGRCYVIAPDLFEPDEFGYSHEVGNGSVPSHLDAQARLAVANCPEQAITIEEG